MKTKAARNKAGGLPEKPQQTIPMKTNNKLRFLFNCALGVLFAVACGFNPVFGALGVNAIGLAINEVNKSGTAMFDGLAAEVWIPLVKEDFYPDNSFLSAATDMSALVDNDKINFAEAGSDPDVLKNNTTYPINAADASDSPLSVELDYYDTESTIIRNAVAAELVYDQRALYANKHKKALLKKIGMDAAYAYAPTQNATLNPVIALGANDSVIDGVIDLQRKYNELDDDGTNRNLVLCPAHLAAIAKEDKVLYKAMMATPGSIFYGFKIWTYSQNPIYVTATGVKAAQGTAYNSGTHSLASFAFLGSEVMKAIGTVELFSQLKDPDIKGDKINFQMRALVAKLRNKYAGALLKN